MRLVDRLGLHVRILLFLPRLAGRTMLVVVRTSYNFLYFRSWSGHKKKQVAGTTVGCQMINMVWLIITSRYKEF
jgi:hypothetical protein